MQLLQPVTLSGVIMTVCHIPLADWHEAAPSNSFRCREIDSSLHLHVHRALSTWSLQEDNPAPIAAQNGAWMICPSGFTIKRKDVLSKNPPTMRPVLSLAIPREILNALEI